MLQVTSLLQVTNQFEQSSNSTPLLEMGSQYELQYHPLARSLRTHRTPSRTSATIVVVLVGVGQIEVEGVSI